MTSEQLMTQEELAFRWKISEATLERDRSLRRGVRYLKIGGLIRYRFQDVLAYEDACVLEPALRAALAEPKDDLVCVCGAVWEGDVMVHAPRQRHPLTEPELHEINPTWPMPGQKWGYEDVLAFARAIERAHGIGVANGTSPENIS